MTTGGYEAFDDPYCYPGTSILKNLHDIRDIATLEAFEAEISALRAEEPLPEGQLDTDHYRSVHHHLFQDVYEWAGQYRTVRISKGASAFCYPEHIPTEMETLFRGLKHGDLLLGLDSDSFVLKIAQFLSELNAIHPFREGNGRTQLTFVGLLGATFEHTFAFERLQPARFLQAMVSSYFGDRAPLISELNNLLRSGSGSQG